MMLLFIYLLASLSVLTYLTFTSSSDPTEESGEQLTKDILSWTLLSLVVPLYFVLFLVISFFERAEKLIFGGNHAK